jgi:CubicO group peptidase (beta-lactamase class C family)
MTEEPSTDNDMSPTAAAGPKGTGIDPTALEALMTRARREVDEGLLPSCQVAVALDSEVVAFESFGASGPDRRYVIFSCTKALIAGAVWLLLADGSLRLDQPVAEAIPGFAENDKDTITVAQLLVHQSGFPHAPLNPASIPTREQRLERFATWRLNWEPGTRFEYHPTSAHWVLAELIESTSGIDYRTFVHTRVLDPLGLDRLRLGEPADRQGDIVDLEVCGEPPTAAELESMLGIGGLTLDQMVGEVTADALMAFNRPDVRALGVPGAGGIADAASLALYYQALLHDRGGLWDPEWLAAGTREIHGDLPDPLFGVPSHRTLGLMLAGDGATARFRGYGHTVSPRAFGHAGAGGQIAFADPDTGISFVYLTNGLDANVLREHRRTAGLASRAGLLV